MTMGSIVLTRSMAALVAVLAGPLAPIADADVKPIAIAKLARIPPPVIPSLPFVEPLGEVMAASAFDRQSDGPARFPERIALMTRRFLLPALLATTALPAFAQPMDTGSDSEADEGQEIVVTGQKPRGSVVGDIPPENVLNTRDIRATGATSISELLSAVAPQTGSARGRGGGMPVLLLNGQRISGFRELRDLPPEAIERMEILPEEVALKYGYSADQRVVNIVLRRRFNSSSVELRGKAATDGGYVQGQADATRLIIDDGKRTTLNLQVSGNDGLTEADRSIVLQPVASQPDPIDPRPYRSLTGANKNVRLSGTANRQILGDVSATFNAELQRTTGQSRFGVATGVLDDNGTDILRAFPGTPLDRTSVTEAARMGFALNGTKGKWRWSSTGNAELSRSLSESERGFDLTGVQARLDANDPTLDPLGDLGPLQRLSDNRSVTINRSLGANLTATGPLIDLPAGKANVTLKIGASSTDLEGRSRRNDLLSETNLGRDIVEGSASVDLPITRGSSSIGRLTANANAGIKHLSDFGGVTSLGAGLNWSPTARLSFVTSWTREKGPPTLSQLGAPLVDTPGVPYFDFRTNQTVLVTTVTGGNPDLKADTRNVLKIGGNWQFDDKPDLRLRAEYVRQVIDNPQASFPVASAALEDAFPDRFERQGGVLTRVFLQPVNFKQSRREQLRIGFDFSKELESKPPSAQAIAAFREQFRARAQRDGIALPGPQAAQTPAAGSPQSTTQSPPTAGGAPTPPQGEAPPANARGPGGPGGPGGFGRFGNRNGGRLTFSLTDTVTLVDEATIRSGLPKLDYLDGEASGALGGRSRHEVEAQAGYFNNGMGARVSANWRSGTTVRGANGDLDFSPYATFDLRLFANLGERFDLVSKHPWLRGTSVRFEVTNIFNARPKVRDSAGNTPFSYQPDLIEPIGRTVGISIRKLFVPLRFFTQQRGQRPGG
nr:TonB-dependent receptor plug domain-containing protein [Sphingomonas jaspsi]